MEPLAKSIIVGVSGKGENTEALRFAADEARLRGVGLTLVHVVHHRRRRGSSGSPDSSWSQAGQRILEEARAKLGSLGAGSLAVETILREGNPGEVLTELSADAALVVLQHRDLSRLQRIRTGSTVASVAAHAPCSVVSVPPSHDPSVPGVVTVGVHEDAGPEAVVETAFAEAEAHGWAIRLVYAWNVASAYGDMVAEEEHWTTEVRDSIGAAADKLRDRHPDVPVTVEVHHEWPADLLTRLSGESELLVVGRHSHHVPLQPRLGSLARSAIVHAECPVLIVAL
jgi:nucleotide-binding universal stress UspA family protein